MTASAESLLLTREEAAELCRVSLKSFLRHVAPKLSRVRIGTRVLFDREDIVAWINRSKAGPSAETSAPESGVCVTPSPVVDITDRRALEIAARLRNERRRSTQRR
jgi:hypothetical protein